jgi:sodium transport system ATP-binding protein
VIFSSHIMQEVAALCDRIVVIANGTGGRRRHAG